MIDNPGTLLDSLYDGAYIMDTERKIVYWNHSAEIITGFNRDEVIGKSCADNILRHVDDDGNQLCLGGCPLSKTINDSISSESKVYLHNKLGYRIPVSVRCSPIRDDKGSIVGGLEIFCDNSLVDNLKSKVAELESMAYVDTLTKVANRRFADISISQRVEEFNRYNWSVGIFLLDIDKFKDINDKYGHNAGDNVLSMVSQTLAHNCRMFDLVARWGGDEFVGVLRGVDESLMLQLTERMRMLIEQSFLEFEGTNLSVTCSIGGTLAQKDESVEEIISRADKALYMSKDAGRNKVTFL